MKYIELDFTAEIKFQSKMFFSNSTIQLFKFSQIYSPDKWEISEYEVVTEKKALPELEGR